MRCHLIGGPFHRTCEVLDLHGADVRHEEILFFCKVEPFFGVPPIIPASVCDEGEHDATYQQRRNDDGSPALNCMGDIFYDFVESSKETTNETT